MCFEDWWARNGSGEPSPLVLKAWDAAAESERQTCAQIFEMNNDQLRLMAGEMSAQELRTVQAVLTSIAQKIRSRSARLNKQARAEAA